MPRRVAKVVIATLTRGVAVLHQRVNGRHFQRIDAEVYVVLQVSVDKHMQNARSDDPENGHVQVDVDDVVGVEVSLRDSRMVRTAAKQSQRQKGEAGRM